MLLRVLALLLAAFLFGCDELLLAKEDRARIDHIRELVSRGPSRIDAPDEEGQPPVHRAVLDGYSSLLVWLLDRGADPNARSAQGKSALELATTVDATRDRWFIRTLVRRGADRSHRDRDGRTPLAAASERGTPVEVTALLGGRKMQRRRARGPRCGTSGRSTGGWRRGS